jgi:hypothetical protein
LHGEEQAGAHRLAVEQDRASAANAMLATNVRSRESEIVAQEIGEKFARFYFPAIFMTVDG